MKNEDTPSGLLADPTTRQDETSQLDYTMTRAEEVEAMRRLFIEVDAAEAKDKPETPKAAPEESKVTTEESKVTPEETKVSPKEDEEEIDDVIEALNAIFPPDLEPEKKPEPEFDPNGEREYTIDEIADILADEMMSWR